MKHLSKAISYSEEENGWKERLRYPSRRGRVKDEAIAKGYRLFFDKFFLDFVNE